METADPTDLLSTQLARPAHAFGGFTSDFVRNHVTSSAILLFSAIFILVQVIKPSFLYNRDGSLRAFGIGTKNKTVVPMWLVAIILGIVSYFIVMQVSS
jgi:hypothetical protein